MLFYILMEIIPLGKHSGLNLDFELHKSISNEVLGVIQISHGMAEHTGRYSYFIEFLNKNGFHVLIHNHRGHGARLLEQRLGFFGSSNGWEKAVEDIKIINSKSINLFPDLPQILLGHSMGSWLAMSCLQQGGNFDILLLSGSSKPRPIETFFQKMLLNFEIMRLGKKGYSHFLHKIIFGGFNSKFKNTKTDNDWLSRDAKSVKEYAEDPLCGFVVSNQLWVDVINGIKEVFKPSQLQLLKKEIPILVFSGSDDPVGGMGQGTSRLHKTIKNIGCNSHLYLIEGDRHETLNETNKMKTYNYLVNFLKENI